MTNVNSKGTISMAKTCDLYILLELLQKNKLKKKLILKLSFSEYKFKRSPAILQTPWQLLTQHSITFRLLLQNH